MICIRSLNWLVDPLNFGYTSFRIRRTNLDERQSLTLCYNLPVFGNLAYSKSEPPRIWGITATLTYLLIRCLLPDKFMNSNLIYDKLSEIIPSKFPN